MHDTGARRGQADGLRRMAREARLLTEGLGYKQAWAERRARALAELQAMGEPACSLCGSYELKALATLKDGSRYMACESCNGRGLRGPLSVEVVR